MNNLGVLVGRGLRQGCLLIYVVTMVLTCTHQIRADLCKSHVESNHGGRADEGQDARGQRARSTTSRLHDLIVSRNTRPIS